MLTEMAGVISSAVAAREKPHISVCICTYKRPEMLDRLLRGLAGQQVEDKFTYSIVIADNDSLRSAEKLTMEFRTNSGKEVFYCVQPKQNISLTRNCAVENARGDYIAFIDDDEFPTDRWLLTLFKACDHYQADGVLGPVKPHFDETPPSWVIAGKFYDRPSYPTGLVIDGKKGRTGNVLLKRHIFAGLAQPFRPEFLTGEDQDFFRRMIEKGFKFVWCHEAMAYEVVPPIRWNRSFMLRRALLRGATSLEHPTVGTREILKSVMAVPSYLLILLPSLLQGQGAFMKYLVKLFDHLGRLLAFVGIKPVREAYVTQ
jgi:succinoglycan biosynthesis protein ExoM